MSSSVLARSRSLLGVALVAILVGWFGPLHRRLETVRASLPHFQVPLGRGRLLAWGPGGRRGRSVPVWSYRPRQEEERFPVLFLLHGVGRDARDYLEGWIPWAEARGVLLLAPEFSRLEFPSSRRYSQGHVLTRSGRRRREARWSFTFPEKIFQGVRGANPGLVQETFSVFGHSAGAQFAHRLVLLRPQAPLGLVVAANAGWYTWPDRDQLFPLGLGGIRGAGRRLRAALGRELVVLLGTRDRDPEHPHLRHEPDLDARGRTRWDRGQAFFRAGREAAAREGVPLAWRLEPVPGIGHSHRGMCAAAQDLLEARGMACYEAPPLPSQSRVPGRSKVPPEDLK